MVETVWRFSQPINDGASRLYEARVCGGPMAGGSWEGWLEFVPIAEKSGSRAREPGAGRPTRHEREDGL